MKTLRLFLVFLIPLYLLDQATKWWCVLHFHYARLAGVDPSSGKNVYYYFNAEGVEGAQRVQVVDSYFWFTRVHNQGVAWGLGNGSSWAPVVFLIIPIVALFVIRLLWKKGFFKLKPARYAAPLIVVGILGNLTDRLVQGFFLSHLEGESFFTKLGEGYVVDFLAVKIPLINYNFPVFNVADSCVSIAAFLLLVTAVFENKLASKQGVQI